MTSRYGRVRNARPAAEECVRGAAAAERRDSCEAAFADGGESAYSVIAINLSKNPSYPKGVRLG